MSFVDGLNGSFELQSSKYNTFGVSLRVNWSEKYDVAGNKSVISIDSVEGKCQYYEGIPNLPGGTISVNGTEVIAFNSALGTHALYFGNKDTYREITEEDETPTEYQSVEVEHNSDGTKSVTVAVNISGWSSALGTWYVSGTESITLTTIPRATTFTAEDGTLGKEQTLSVDLADSTFKHRIMYSCGTASGYVAGSSTAFSTASSVSWTPPLTLASQNTTDKSVAVTLTVTTYDSAGTEVGTSEKVISCAIPESVKPSCVVTVTDYMGYAEPDQYGVYIRRLSRMNVVVTPSLAYGAEIVSFSTTANGATYTEAEFVTDALKSAGTLTITAAVTDSRGRTGTATATVEVLDYTAPAITSLTAVRCNSNGAENENGEYIKVTFSAAVTPLNNKNTAEYILHYKKSSVVDWDGVALDELYGDFTVTNHSFIFAADTGSSYDVDIQLEDAHIGTVRATTAPTAFALMHPHESGTGIAFGKICEKSNAIELGLSAYDKYGTLIGNGLAAYTGGGDSGIDPNTTLEELCLTSHSNGPQRLGTFYYIHTAFYNTKSTTAARMQVAIPYNKTGSSYHRYYANGAWSSWSRYMTADEIYPIGSVCIRYDTTSPATLYGGEWKRIEGRMLFGCASSGTVGAPGTHTTGSGSSSLPYVNVAIWRREA